jgi:hypothetical protein
MREASYAVVLLISGCATPIYWLFPAGTTQQDFARDDYECINEVKVVSQPQQQNSTYVIQQNNSSGNNTAVVSGQSQPGSAVAGAAESLQRSLASMPTTYVNPNMYKLCMRAKGYVQGQKP